MHGSWYFSYYLCLLSASEVDSASCWLLLYEYIMMHGPQNIKQ